MNERHSRQGFLGEQAPKQIETCRIAIAGLGGGGSHIVQQLAHIGFRNFAIYDPDIVEDTNLNRLIGATLEDVAMKRMKVAIAERLIRGLCANPSIQAIPERWEDKPDALRSADIVFGCLDGFAAREALEAATRRNLIPLIDIGMDVHQREGTPPRMAGQVILSMPGSPCMKCLGFLTEENLTKEAAKYGAAGPRPQVVWANGVLASSAVGIAVDLLTGWAGLSAGPQYLSYDGNQGLVRVSPRLTHLPSGPCTHYPSDEVGDPVYRKL